MNEYVFQAKIVDCYPESGAWKVKLDKSFFYPGGGGQPCDTGHVRALGVGTSGVGGSGGGFSCRVVDVVEQKDGSQLLICTPETGIPEPGTTVEASIDAGRRAMFTKLHTGEHILFRSIQNVVEARKEELTLKKMELREHEGVIFASAHELTWDDLLAAERTANHIVHEDVEITERVIGRTDIHKYPLLRIKAERIPGDKIRVLSIGDFDMSACKGTHCKRTSEVGGILVTAFNQAGKGNYEIRFTTDLTDLDTQEKLFTLAAEARKAAAIAGTSPTTLAKTIGNLKETNEQLKLQLKEFVKSGTGVTFDEKKEGDVTLYSKTLSGFDHKKITELVRPLLNEHTVVCVLNDTGDKTQIYLFSNSKHDAGALMKELMATLGGRGGGKKEAASGSVEQSKGNDVLKQLEQMILA